MIFFAVIVGVLSAWAAVEGFEWHRVELDELTGESAGGCGGNNTAKWFTPIVLLMMIPITLTARMAWLTRDVDSMYSESHWIVILIVSQVQLLLISIPLLILVDSMSPNVRYVGQSSVFSVFSLSTMFLIFGPKIYGVYYVKQANSSQGPTSRARGSTVGGVHVSGLAMSLPNTTLSRQSVTRTSVSSRGGASVMLNAAAVTEGLDFTETNVDGEDFATKPLPSPRYSWEQTDGGVSRVAGGLNAVVELDYDTANCGEEKTTVDIQLQELASAASGGCGQKLAKSTPGPTKAASDDPGSDNDMVVGESDETDEEDSDFDDDLSRMSSQAGPPPIIKISSGRELEGSSNAFTVVHSNRR